MCGFTSGVPGAVAGIGGILTVYKASSYNYDLRKKSLCTERLQLVFGFAIIMNSFFGISFNISFLKNDNDDSVNDVYMTHVILSACILSGIILLLLVTFLSYITICYQPKGYNQRINYSYYPNTVGGTQYHQGQSPYAQQDVYSTGGYYPGSNPPPYTPPPPYFGIGQNSTQYGVQPTSVPTAPAQPYSYYP
ncbi:uncharacterized protein LOC132729632 [Ruditapes philippinarum]|uniref:uncharacterized protein LOC132729632 n=1 Tax=Ruditapes philippinarum TaxID=129788 RepID=UPI00295B1E85|nr:uncharacterized protein LOC132729632 [Ruditapes philippinarum]